MKRVVFAMLAVILMGTAAKANGLNAIGQTGGYLNPTAEISNRLTVGMHYTDLNANKANALSVTGGLRENLELGVTRSSESGVDTNTYHAKLGFSFKEKNYKTSFAVGASATDVESVKALNTFDYFVAGQFKMYEKFDVTLGVRSSNEPGDREYLGEATVGFNVNPKVSVFGEFKQNERSQNNQWAAFVRLDNDNSVLDIGITDAAANATNQVFLGLNASL